MKKITLILAVFLLSSAVSASAKPKDIQLSFVLSAEEAKGQPTAKYSFVSQPGGKAKELLISKDILLSQTDIKGIIVIRKEDTKMKELPFIDIVFTKDGAKKLEQITKGNLRKSMAIIVGDKVLSAPYIIYPITTGHIAVSHWSVSTNDAAASLIKETGFTPIYKGQVQKTLGSI